MKYFFLIIFILFSVKGFSFTISGSVKNKKGEPLPYASILIKGTTEGTTANINGLYSLTINAGTYTIICQHIGYKSVEKKINISNKSVIINFELEMQSYTLTDVVVQAGGEDPAYEIIRNAIKKREEYLNEINKFQCEVYIKGQLQLRDYPTKILGKKVEFDDGDTSKKRMLYLSESIANLYVQKPKYLKVDVVSTRVSGYSDGFGFSYPQMYSFYENIVTIGRGLNPRGFVSPISNNALSFYKYKFEGTFYDNGKEINRIKVIPKRKYEPLFSGYISITENDWRIYSTELYLLQEQQMQLLDTLHIQQLYTPLKYKWVLSKQVIYPTGKILGFDFFGSFVQVFSHYDINPNFKKGFFDNVIMKVNDSANKKSKTYWDTIRPVPLLDEEAIDYRKKDSIEQVRKSPEYLDSIDRKNNKLSVLGIFVLGQDFTKRKNKVNISLDPLLNAVNYNSVEGWMIDYSISYRKRYTGRKSLTLTPEFRYGFNNKHFNSSLTGSYNFGKKYFKNLSVSGGKGVFQINNENPISARDNTISTLLYTANHMKLYEAWFTKLNYRFDVGKGISFYTSFEYQDRLRLENLDNIQTWRTYKDRSFTPNNLDDIFGPNSFKSHKAAIASLLVKFRPGSKYIQLPDRIINLGSKYPIFSVGLSYGIKGLFNSDVDFSRWNFSLFDELNMKLGGVIKYKVDLSGFLHANKIYTPDYYHINGSQTIEATPYLNSFQLAPYYALSNTSKFITVAHVAYHLNGLITNKIPVFKRWNWFFVLSGSALVMKQPNIQYYEAMFSIENIFKVIRVDFIQSFSNNKEFVTSGFGITLPGLLTGN
ncbi:MAG: DUF5686 and carboxypeptidase regulatory-like domain-containing protein [Chitinophagales bacterium]|nr:DUF5686 and carboxypeptidase regulatory-like domain-containing protein [Chitinophagales bacterium]